MIARIRQGLIFIFGRYKEEWNNEIKRVLTPEEYEIFKNMSRYDRIHSFRLYRLVKDDELLGEKRLYQKLALLHDCGKYNASLYRRVKKVLIGEKSLENHSEISYEKLKNIDIELAKLAREHHSSSKDIYLKRFQKLDDE